jgi:hypothetical protein
VNFLLFFSVSRPKKEPKKKVASMHSLTVRQRVFISSVSFHLLQISPSSFTPSWAQKRGHPLS